jgi:hypothetical protein
LSLDSAKSKIDLLPNKPIQLSRCCPFARAWTILRSFLPAIRWSVGSAGAHGSGERWWWTHEDGSRTCLGRLTISAVGARSSRGPPGGLQFSVSAALRRNGSSAVGTGSGGGDEETRTPDPLLAKEMLCQLSYVPLPGGYGGRFWTRTRDLCLIRAVL